MSTKTKVRVWIVALLLVGIFGFGWWRSRVQWIPAGYIGVIYNAHGGLESKIYKPQALYIGFFQTLYTYPTTVQNALYTQDPSAGELKAADGILITTSDNANTTFDVSVIYRVKEEDVFRVFNAFGAIPIADIQTLHLRRAVRDATSEVGSQYDVFQLMGPAREEASDKLTKSLQAKMAIKGITVDRALILNAYPANDMAQKINSRVNGYTLLQISQLQSQIAEINRQASVVQGEAQQKAQSLTASQTVDKSLAFIRLELQEAAVDKWNGHLSPLSSDGKQTIVIGGNGVIPQVKSR